MDKLNVIIGRFSGFHAGHEYLIETALFRGGEVVVLIGSANRPRTIKNPWTWQERRDTILQRFPDITILPINDYKYNDEQWISDVNYTVEFAKNVLRLNDPQITLYGHEKPDTDYLRWFPNWRYFRVESDIVASATVSRHWMFKHTPEVFSREVLNDFKYFEKEQELFNNYPFKDTLNFNCADSIVECAGHILLVQRKNAPGENTWALPGGFKNSNESFLDCAIRELLEETNLRVPEKVLRGSVVSKFLFDDPTRGCGIPRSTLGVYIKIDKDRDGNMPRANGSSDAKAAVWVPINDIMNKYRLFDDHQDIISKMTGAMPVPAVINLDN